MDINKVSGAIVDASIKIHSALGPGLLESAYEACLAHELRLRGFHVASQVPLPIRYDGIVVDAGYRVDLLVEELVLVELKSVEALLPVHQAQVMTYLRLSGLTLGLLINFNTVLLKHGIKRFANKLKEGSARSAVEKE